jgi:hypothetical protein
VIGHFRMDRNFFAHASGDAINGVLAAAYNLRRLRLVGIFCRSDFWSRSASPRNSRRPESALLHMKATIAS